MDKRISGYDLARSFAIIFVFIAHIVLAQSTNKYSTIVLTSISPGITMSLLAFISAVLLSNNKTLDNNYGVFLFKRFTRLFIPVFICLSFAVILVKFQGMNIQIDHLIYNYIGLSLFFDWFKVPNNASVGWGLWFITAILVMYIFLPLLKLLFKHKNGLIHFILFYLVCVVINIITIPPETSFWNVAVSFGVGVFVSCRDKVQRMIDMKWTLLLPLLIFTIAACLASASNIVGIDLRKFLFPIYPIVFIPIFFKIGNILPKSVNNLFSKFSEMSFEFYMLQFYFINYSFARMFGNGFSLIEQILIGFLICLFLSFVFSKLGNMIKNWLESYILASNKGEKKESKEAKMISM